jgi:DNA-binding transcriptional LysR family regulator
MLPHVPLSFLRVCKTAGRTGSFRAVAAELNLTPSAVSHAIRKLEEALGTNLFLRDARAVRLSYEGEALMRHVSRAFDELRRGMEAVSTRGPQLLRLHSAPSFAAQWLSPRLSRFLSECPGIEVRLSAGTDYTKFATDEFDADIVYGSPRVNGLVVVPLGEETVTPLCSPALAAGIGRPADLLDRLLIQSDNKLVRWPDWFAANGLSAPPPQGMRFDRSFLALAAAADGLGIALESTGLAERELASGRLVAPLDGRAEPIRYVGHNLVFPKFSRRRRNLQVFTAWLLDELGLPQPTAGA